VRARTSATDMPPLVPRDAPVKRPALDAGERT
jgi:hypothetical protein